MACWLSPAPGDRAGPTPLLTVVCRIFSLTIPLFIASPSASGFGLSFTCEPEGSFFFFFLNSHLPMLGVIRCLFFVSGPCPHHLWFPLPSLTAHCFQRQGTARGGCQRWLRTTPANLWNLTWRPPLDPAALPVCGEGFPPALLVVGVGSVGSSWGPGTPLSGLNRGRRVNGGGELTPPAKAQAP